VAYEAHVEGAPSEDVLLRLIEEAKEAGADRIEIETTHEDGDAWIRAGFTETARVLEAPISALEAHVGNQKEPSFGSIHVQTDDVDAVVRAVRQFVPRLPGGSQGSVVLSPRDGWTSAYDELTDREPEMLRRLARELSDRMGAVTLLLGIEREELVRMILFEYGRIVDEYLSVPEFYGPLPPGEVVALAANPRVVSRLTGADPESVRRIAVTAPSPADLRPAPEILSELASAVGIVGAEHGWADAPEIDGAVRIERG
jgi:hypothetical protein